MPLDIYSTRTASDILTDMLDTVDASMDKREGSVVHDMLAPVAIESEMLGYELDGILELGFIATSEGDFLTSRCAELGVDRKLGEYARGQVTFAGKENTFIDAGTVVASLGEVEFATVSEIIIDASGVASTEVIALDVGIAGNVGVGEISVFDVGLEGVTSVTNELATNGGVDEESDDLLKERYYAKVRSPITSGNVFHYQSLATEVVGVGSASVTPLHAGPGTVKVVIANERGGAISPEALTACKEHIEDNAIIGADVTVVGVTEVSVAIGVKVVLASGQDLEQIKSDITDAIKAYFESASTERVVRVAQVGNAIIDVDGVIDYSDLTLNKATANIALNDESVAVVGALAVTV